MPFFLYNAAYMNQKFTKPYDPQSTEQEIYKTWEKSGYFNPDNLPARHKESFTIVLPPPNVTGVLHLGHAYEDTLQDSIIRFQRMNGRKTLWVPGTDSAAIATQSRVEKNIKKDEGKTRHDLGREELVKRVSDYAKQSEENILNQVKRMGASLDWSRYAYTLDEKRSLAVSTAFKRMYEMGLIYRGNRIVNWDPKGQTTISDDEVVYEERDAKLYTFKYSKEFPIAISTTRPETKVGDTAVAVHPDDERYKKFIGQEFDLVFCDVPIHIKIVADKSVEMEFGTGALGVTPAHSQTDWEIADKHNLNRPQVINEYAKMMVPGRLNNLKVEVARGEVVSWIKENELLEKEELVKQNVSTSERTGAIIEPLPKLQWWINVNKKIKIENSEITGIEVGAEMSLKEIMTQSVRGGDVKFRQENMEKIYFHWVDNLRDWCISRQIWFGHRIPVWYRGEEIICSINKPSGDGWSQEEDVLDTWFSSALWTFSTLGWPAETEDLKNFHPTNFMSPAYEILPLWVSRMILMSAIHLGQAPFKEVLIHGLVRDKSGRKFSKSLGNGIDPIEMINKYGADALRMGLIIGSAVGNDIKFDESQIKGYKHFANKIWNVTRFILKNNEKIYSADASVDGDARYPVSAPDEVKISEEDEKIILELNEIINDITTDFENYRLYMAAEKIYHYIWHKLADQIIEESKPILNGDDYAAKASRQKCLLMVLRKCITILHPFMPFLTEEIWKDIRNDKEDLLIVAEWPNRK